MKQKNLKKSVVGALFGLLLATGAQAANVLYYVDSIVSNDNWGTALEEQNHTITWETYSSTWGSFSSASFNSLASFDLVVLQINGNPHDYSTLSNSLSAYLGNGGKLIYSNFKSSLDATLGVSQQNTNEKNLVITDTKLSLSPLGSNTQQLVSDQYTYTNGEGEPEVGVFSRTLTGGTSLATLGNGSGIIRIGNTIINGFAGETFASTADEIQLYKNEVNMLLAPVPEPDSYAMLLAGLGLMGFMARRRNQKAAK